MTLVEDAKLTEDQWDAVTTAWLTTVENGASKRKRSEFVEKFCDDNNNLPHPKKLSLTRQIQHKQMAPQKQTTVQEMQGMLYS